jgi:hypothetical protein
MLVKEKRVMRHMIRVALVVVVAFLASGNSTAQVPVLPFSQGTIIGSVEIVANDVRNGTSRDVYTVPDGHRLKITDLLVANGNMWYPICCASYSAVYPPSTVNTNGQSAQRTGFISVPPGGTVSHNFLSGRYIPPGAVVTVTNSTREGWYYTDNGDDDDDEGGGDNGDNDYGGSSVHFTLRGYLVEVP